MKRILDWNGLAIRVVAGLAVALLVAGAVGITALAGTPQEFKGKIAKSYEDSKEWWAEPVRPPQGAPNVLILLLDDVGFAQVGSFGGPIETPNIDRLAENELHIATYSLAETFDVGLDTGTQVSRLYEGPSPFVGNLDRVTIVLND